MFRPFLILAVSLAVCAAQTNVGVPPAHSVAVPNPPPPLPQNFITETKVEMRETGRYQVRCVQCKVTNSIAPLSVTVTNQVQIAGNTVTGGHYVITIFKFGCTNCNAIWSQPKGPPEWVSESFPVPVLEQVIVAKTNR